VRAPARLVSGPRACALGAERGHGQRGSGRDGGGGTERTGAEKKKERKEMVTDRWGQAEGMTENRRND
jgi:hypothetical protein